VSASEVDVFIKSGSLIIRTYIGNIAFAAYLIVLLSHLFIIFRLYFVSSYIRS